MNTRDFQPTAACPPNQCPVTFAVNEIKQKLESIDARQNANSERLTRIEENSNYMRKVIEGNGKPGLIGDVDALKKWMYEEQGVSQFRRWIIPVVLSVIFGVTSASLTVLGLAAKQAAEPVPTVQTVKVPTSTHLPKRVRRVRK
jgi:hypothetical protein